MSKNTGGAGSLTRRATLKGAGLAVGGQKPPHGTPAYSRFVNRPIGRRFAALAAAWGWTPNAVSAVSAACSLVGIVLLAVAGSSVLVGALVAIMLVLGYAWDSADGQLARLTGTGSLFGEWLDHMIDCTKISALHIAVGVHLVRFTDLLMAWLLLPALYLIVSNVLFFGMILTDQLRRATATGKATGTGSLSVARSLAILPSDYGALCLIFVTLAWPALFLGLYTFMLLGSALLLVAAVVRWSAMLRSIDRNRTS